MVRRALAGLLLVGLGLALSPDAVPVYDGIGVPDEPYRFVVRPSASPSTAPPTEARVTSPVVDGLSTNGMNLATAEQGPQFNLFIPPRGFATTKGPVEVRAVPQAPADQPSGALVDGNVYLVTVTSPGSPVQRTVSTAIATVYLRATTAKQPGPTMYHRDAAGAPWKALRTSRGGLDFYASAYAGPGQYALAFADTGGGGGVPVPLLVLGGALLLAVVVVVVRLRAASG
jgi:hypothetical protein